MPRPYEALAQSCWVEYHWLARVKQADHPMVGLFNNGL